MDELRLVWCRGGGEHVDGLGTPKETQRKVVVEWRGKERQTRVSYDKKVF